MPSIADRVPVSVIADNLSSFLDESPFEPLLEAYLNAFGDEKIFDDCIEDCRQRLGIVETFADMIDEDLDCDLHYIQSVVGDDEHTTTDSAALGPCLISFGPVVVGIRVSWKDSGISKYVGNYAEGWLLTPPNAEASFEAVNRRNQRSGIPFTLDPVKIKYLSPVRKQSSEEMDLQSKLLHLSEIASWTDRSWFTYDYHQMCLLLANCVFDFEDAISFPYLYKTEGGSGGLPPYGNLDTVFGAMHHYTRGRSKLALVGIMSEAVEINLDKRKPADAFFLRSSHLAQMGDKEWLKVETAYRSLLAYNNLSATEAKALLNQVAGVTLPPDLLEMGVDIQPESFVVGSAISHLRKDGYIMSELDVKLALDKKKRELAVMGTQPIGTLMKEIHEEERLFKSQHFRTLTTIADQDGPVKDYLKGLIGEMPDKPSEELYEVLRAYYRMRSESHDQFSSFYYTNAVRVFKTQDVDDYFGRSNRPLRDDFARMDSFPVTRRKFLEENLEERLRHKFLDDWIASGTLDKILNRPLPPGIGPDDSRLARSIVASLDNVDPNQFGTVSIVLFTGDKKLLRTTAALIRGCNLPFQVVLGGIDRNSYVEICLDGVFTYQLLQNRGELDAKGFPRRQTYGEQVLYYNFLLKRSWPMPRLLISQLDGLRDSETRKKTLVHIEYDYPNMERGLDLIRFRRDTNTIETFGGGFLDRKTIESLRKDTCWSQLPLDDIFQWPDFDTSKLSTHYRLRRGFRQDRLYVLNPVSRATYSKIERWRHDLPSK